MSPNEFIAAHTTVARAPLVPEVALHLAAEITPIWQASEEWLKQRNIEPPFWAFAWPGGQALARAGSSSTARASACPPGQAKAQKGGSMLRAASHSSVACQIGVISVARCSATSGTSGGRVIAVCAAMNASAFKAARPGRPARSAARPPGST